MLSDFVTGQIKLAANYLSSDIMIHQNALMGLIWLQIAAKVLPQNFCFHIYMFSSKRKCVLYNMFFLLKVQFFLSLYYCAAMKRWFYFSGA
jgi:hypothetical protein